MKIKKLFDIEDDIKDEDSTIYLPKKVVLNNDRYIEKLKTKRIHESNNWKKLTWNTERQMLSKFEMAEKVIDFSKVKSWIDIGCGTGEFFKHILDNNNIENVTGFDAVEEFMNISKNDVNVNYNINYIVDNIITTQHNETYDLVTCSGIMQVFDYDKLDIMFSNFYKFLNPGGQIWIDTLNFYYEKFNNKRVGGVYTFKMSEIENLLSKFGFKEIESKCFSVDGVLDDKESCFHVYGYGKK